MVLPLVASAARIAVGRGIRKGARSLRSQSQQPQFTGQPPSVILYLLVGVIALTKDATDFIFGFLPVFGIIFAFIIGLCISLVIFLLLLVFDKSSGMKMRFILKRLIILMLAMVIDMLPVVSFVPIETASVGLMYILARRAWKKSKSESPAPSTQQSKPQSQSARMARAIALREKRARHEDTSAGPIVEETAAMNMASRSTPMRLTQQMSDASFRSESDQARRQSSLAATGLTRGRVAANDTHLTTGKRSTDAAMMRIREVGARLSQTPSALRSSGTGSIIQRRTVAPLTQMDMKRAV